MRIGKLFVLIFIILNACSTYSKEGVYYTVNLKNTITTQYNYFELEFDCISNNGKQNEYLNNKKIKFYFPRQTQKSLGGGYNVTITPVLLPVLSTNKKLKYNEQDFYIMNYIPGQKNNKFKIDLKIDGKIFHSLYNDGIYIFSLKIKDVKKGTLIIEYEGIKKEIDFEYGFKWFYYH